MPLIRVTPGSANQRYFFGAPLAPGILYHATLHAHSTVLQPGDLYARIYITLRDDPTLSPYASLTDGLITLGAPLIWIANLTIEEPSQLRVLLLGYTPDDFTLSWGRLTTTNLHQVGDYARTIQQ